MSRQLEDEFVEEVLSILEEHEIKEEEPKTSKTTWLIRGIMAVLLILLVVQFDINVPSKTAHNTKIIYYPIAMVTTTKAVAEVTEDFGFTFFMGCSHRHAPKPKVFHNNHIDRI